MEIKQLSIFLENRSGRLAHVTGVLADAGINLLALSLADTSDYGILRLIVDDVDKAAAALRDKGVLAMVTVVTAVEVEDKPGGLTRILRLLDQAGVNVEYMYAFSEPQTGRAAVIFRFDDPQAAVECLQASGVNVFAQVDLA